MKVSVAITGASGSIYASRLIEILKDLCDTVYVIATESGLAVAQYELGQTEAKKDWSLIKLLKRDLKFDNVKIFEQDNLFAPIASGSALADKMVLIPCSMGTLARVAQGISSNLIERSADAMIKEQRKLVIVPRETPLSPIHLENMLKLSRMGVHMIPAMPAFYHHPQSIDDLVDFVVSRVLDSIGLQHPIQKRWNQRMA
jgi:flavin prenyltransferase